MIIYLNSKAVTSDFPQSKYLSFVNNTITDIEQLRDDTEFTLNTELEIIKQVIKELRAMGINKFIDHQNPEILSLTYSEIKRLGPYIITLKEVDAQILQKEWNANNAPPLSQNNNGKHVSVKQQPTRKMYVLVMSDGTIWDYHKYQKNMTLIASISSAEETKNILALKIRQNNDIDPASKANYDDILSGADLTDFVMDGQDFCKIYPPGSSLKSKLVTQKQDINENLKSGVHPQFLPSFKQPKPTNGPLFVLKDGTSWEYNFSQKNLTIKTFTSETKNMLALKIRQNNAINPASKANYAEILSGSDLTDFVMAGYDFGRIYPLKDFSEGSKQLLSEIWVTVLAPRLENNNTKPARQNK